MRYQCFLINFVLLALIVSQAVGKGGRGGGRGSGRGGTYSTMSRGSYNRGYSKTTKFKDPSKYSYSRMNAMQKVALIGLGAYTGHKLAKAKSKFESTRLKIGPNRWSYYDWSEAAQKDGFLCRDTNDCFLDEDLVCYDSSLRRNSAWNFGMYSGWFGGDAAEIQGKCICPDNFWWDDDELMCQMFWEPGIAWWVILLIVLGVLSPAIIAGCCWCITGKEGW